MLAVVRALSSQAGTAELVLVEPLAYIQAFRFDAASVCGEGESVDICGTNPGAAKSGALRTNVVVHFPARAASIGGISSSNSIDHVPAYRVAEISETI